MKILNTSSLSVLVVGLVTLFMGQANAAEPGAIELRAQATKVVVVTNDDGTTRTEYVEPELVVPGDKIAYTIAAKNVSTDEVERVVITDPIPNEMLFVAGSEESADATVRFSVDGGVSFGSDSELTVVGENGIRRPAMSTDYTHIQWVFEKPLAPASERSVRFVALVE